MNGPGLRILYLATKPAFPTTDGGKLLMWNTIKELASRGHQMTFIAPDLGQDVRDTLEQTAKVCTPRLIPNRPGNLIPSFFRALFARRPLSVLRHSHRNLRLAVHNELARRKFDLIHVEQVQSLYNLPQDIALPPLVLRAQNVESHLWRMVSKRRPGLAWIARNEARKMSAYEAGAVGRVCSTIVLTQFDGEALAGALGMEARRIRVIPPPFPRELPRSDEPLEGDPPVILLGGGWLPNRDSVQWFFEAVWHDIREAAPNAHVHVFGGTPINGSPGASWHPPPTDSQQLFPKDAILAVPLRVASGIRMKIIEAWARGTPVVATPQAVGGLNVQHGHEVLLASTGKEFGAAIKQLRVDTTLKRKIIEGGRKVLSTYLDPDRVGDLLEAAYRQAATVSAKADT
jgi:glycosyltransferase involved in cell wall biosynthesis